MSKYDEMTAITSLPFFAGLIAIVFGFIVLMFLEWHYGVGLIVFGLFLVVGVLVFRKIVLKEIQEKNCNNE